MDARLLQGATCRGLSRGAAPESGPMRRRPAQLVRGGCTSPVGEPNARNLLVARLGRVLKRRPAARIGGVCNGAMLQQEPHDGRVAVRGGDVQEAAS